VDGVHAAMQCPLRIVAFPMEAMLMKHLPLAYARPWSLSRTQMRPAFWASLYKDRKSVV